MIGPSSITGPTLLLAPLVHIHVHVHGHGALWQPTPRNDIRGSPAADAASEDPFMHPFLLPDANPDCAGGACWWFTQPATLPPPGPTLPTGPGASAYRTYNVDVDGGPDDWTARSPWRSPGAAGVAGSGCGINGGTAIAGLEDGGNAVPGFAQGQDGYPALPERDPVMWKAGEAVEVKWAVEANHGGGYSYRMCRLPEKEEEDSYMYVSEACFQRTHLDFVGTEQWIENRLTGQRVAIPRTVIDVGTTPPNSSWAKNPIPGCNYCDPVTKCKIDVTAPPPLPEPGLNNPWMDEILCTANCVSNQTKEERNVAWEQPNVASAGASCPDGLWQFPPPAPGISGYANVNATRFSLIVDLIRVPENLPPGRYLLGWRWDCEESTQIWQNCADVLVVAAAAEVDIEEEYGGDKETQGESLERNKDDGTSDSSTAEARAKSPAWCMFFVTVCVYAFAVVDFAGTS